jgi:hypothetical protein
MNLMQLTLGAFRPLITDSSQLAKVSAANALLDRAYGKPAVKEEKEIVDLPPVVIQLSTDDKHQGSRLQPDYRGQSHKTCVRTRII